jgi:signal transduction histidine kinase
LTTQVREAQQAAAIRATAVPVLEDNPPPLRKRGTVTDQLADIFDLLSTSEAEKVTLDQVASASDRLSFTFDIPVQAQTLTPEQHAALASDDPLAWLKEAMPQLLLSEEEQKRRTDEMREVAARVRTAPILDMMPPMQGALRPAMLEIRDQSDRLYSGKMGSLTTEQSKAARFIRDHADSALGLLTGVEQVTMVQHGKFKVLLSTFPCTDLVKRARDMMQASARARQHRITFYPPDKPLYTYADFEASLAILIDLLDNAIRYTPVGGATRITLDDLGEHVLINVADNGMGLMESDFQNVGKPFWRATHQPLVRENPGSGLRLYLAQRILMLQNGELIFSGEAGMGSTFSFTLPQVSPDEIVQQETR